MTCLAVAACELTRWEGRVADRAARYRGPSYPYFPRRPVPFGATHRATTCHYDRAGTGFTAPLPTASLAAAPSRLSQAASPPTQLQTSVLQPLWDPP